MPTRSVAVLLAALALASCDWSTFGSLGDDASGVALSAPDGYPQMGFGSVVGGYDGVLGGEHVSRVVIGAGADAPVRAVPLWDGMGVDLGTPVFVDCRNSGDREAGTGVAVAGIPSWRGDALCFVVGGAVSGALDVHCESGPTATPTLVEHFVGPSGIGFGAGLAALPAGFPNGGLVVGAPRAGGTAGALYRVRDDGSAPTGLALGTATTGAASLGSRIAIAPLPSGDALVAATAPGLSTSRVVVLVLHAADGSADVRACLDDTHAGADAALALGDVDGDGLPDLAVGDDAATAGRRELGQLYFGRDLPAATSCGAWGAAATFVACPADVRGVDCASGAFGSALAIGDLDGDHKGELLVGAPNAVVQATTGAGAVYVLPGGASGPVSASADVLTDSTPKADAHLGQSLAVATSRGARVELVAGAPGTGEAIVFLCSGLPNDGPSVGPRCVPPS